MAATRTDGQLKSPCYILYLLSNISSSQSNSDISNTLTAHLASKGTDISTINIVYTAQLKNLQHTHNTPYLQSNR